MLEDARILVTGGAASSAATSSSTCCERYPDYQVINLDKLTYAGNPDNLRDVEDDPPLSLRSGRHLRRRARRTSSWRRSTPSSTSPPRPTSTGRCMEAGRLHPDRCSTARYVLLEAARRHRRPALPPGLHGRGVRANPAGNYARESGPLCARAAPTPPARPAATLQCLAFVATYGLPVDHQPRPPTTSGPASTSEKLVPLFVTNALMDQPLPLYGDGRQVRDWLYVEDHCEALDLIAPAGRARRGLQHRRRQPADEHPRWRRRILELLEKPTSLIRFVEDRPGHDRRYASTRRSCGPSAGRPEHDFFEAALEKTVAWYRRTLVVAADVRRPLPGLLSAPVRRAPRWRPALRSGRRVGPMIQGVEVKQLAKHADERGFLMELLRSDDPIFTQVRPGYVALNYPGVMRAWHWHQEAGRFLRRGEGHDQGGALRSARGFAYTGSGGRVLPGG